MVNYVSDLAKYFILVFLSLYTAECFLVFLFKNEKRRKHCYIRQIIYILIIHFASFLTICLKTGDYRYLFIYVLLEVFVILALELIPTLFKKVNRLLINNVCLLISIGLIILIRLDYRAAIKQFIISIFAVVLGCLILALIVRARQIPNLSYIYAIIGITLLSAVYVLGNITNGSKLSVSVFGISFMPSEFVKILFVLFVAGSLFKDSSFKNLCITTILAAIHIVVLALSTDLGAALILYFVYVVVVFVATRSYLYLGIGSTAGCVAAYFSYKIFRHVRVRVAAFTDPFSVIDNEGYQITQSLFALSSGSWFGMGLYEGSPESIPYVETDFIFSAITQEMGIIFAICLILICLSCFIMYINISFKFSNLFYRYTAIGLGVSYIFQVFLTVGGETKFIPLTGVTLPLVSYGGSSVMATVFSFFILEGLYAIRKADKPNEGISLDEKDYKRLSNISLGLVYLFSACFAALTIYLCAYVYNNKQELLNNSYNPVQEILLSQNKRGNIYSRKNELLATTKVDLDGNEYRFYPFYSIFSHVVGYASNGRAGVEAQANYYLINTNQTLTERIQADAVGDKYDGDGVVTTLDAELQQIAYSAMGTYNGAVIITNPLTGEILAMVSKPDFDPNEIDLIWDDLINDEESSVLLNRATQGLYPPGSTFKIVTLLEYLREHPDDYENYRFICHGSTQYDDGKVVCYNHISHGTLDLENAFAQSCNCAFGDIGLKLDRSSYMNTINSLMFNEDLPLVMNYSKSDCHVSEDFNDLLMVQTSFGQGETLMSPMHVNLITQAIANGGVLMKPYIVSSVVTSNMDIIKEFKPETYKTLMTPEEASTISKMMRMVVTKGTARKLKNKTYEVAGKTGTAEYNDFSSATHAWFTGFAPYDNPEICVTVILEDAGSGNTYAVPVARRIFEEYFRKYDNSEYVPEE